MTLSEKLDAGILAWLIFTWFFEGHHQRPRAGGAS